MTTNAQKHEESGWHFDNSYARLPEKLFTLQEPAKARSPKLVLFNAELAAGLGLNPEKLQSPEGAEIFAGNRLPVGALPLAQAYAGHQFAYFTMLGDGRAVLLGEQMTPKGERFDVQLKGGGRTPYSRGGDGRAALGPMLREYIMSEAMHALGIPTTRSLAVAATGEPVFRESELQGAVLTRVAASHIRVGTFQFAANADEGQELLRALTSYTLERHYPEAASGENDALALLRSVICSQAALLAKWQLAGFIHGVMNTDNMALSGETIDYGPCAFMDAYDPATVFSSIDRQGRYAYGNQPQIAAWNLARLAEALLPLLHEDEDAAVKLAEDELAAFAELYYRHWLAGMRAKLGLFGEQSEDEALVTELLQLMQEHKADYTNTFLRLMGEAVELGGFDLFGSEAFAAWLVKRQARLEKQQEDKEASLQLMKSSNPALIPRNHRVEEALRAAEEDDDYSVLHKLLLALEQPYAHSPEQAQFAELPPKADRPYRTYCGT
ncbi:protein adenylyltransferase SelO [Paenibacillus sp. HB172176]|uniref:protein adenylyltransferase SelO n=1 Tax=Paenibacillus sp. HB172176 TaxID=2493690 RepID=UPI001438B14A|nr:YdiU family protein [Paenibacillus sp. HB172176]